MVGYVCTFDIHRTPGLQGGYSLAFQTWDSPTESHFSFTDKAPISRVSLSRLQALWDMHPWTFRSVKMPSVERDQAEWERVRCHHWDHPTLRSQAYPPLSPSPQVPSGLAETLVSQLTSPDLQGPIVAVVVPKWAGHFYCRFTVFLTKADWAPHRSWDWEGRRKKGGLSGLCIWIWCLLFSLLLWPHNQPPQSHVDLASQKLQWREGRGWGRHEIWER